MFAVFFSVNPSNGHDVQVDWMRKETICEWGMKIESEAECKRAVWHRNQLINYLWLSREFPEPSLIDGRFFSLLLPVPSVRCHETQSAVHHKSAVTRLIAPVTQPIAFDCSTIALFSELYTSLCSSAQWIEFRHCSTAKITKIATTTKTFYFKAPRDRFGFLFDHCSRTAVPLPLPI